MNDIILAIMIVLLFTIILSGCAMLYFLLRNARFGGGSASVSQSDLTNQMILFQSMRETVEQQKDLARQLNFSIDKKVKDVRDIIASVSDFDSRIKGAETALDTLMRDTKEELQSLNRRLGYVKEQAGIEDEPQATSDPIADVVAATPDAHVESQPVEEEFPIPSVIDAQGNEVPYDGNRKLPPLNAIAANFRERHDFVDSWTGVDFGVKDLDDKPVIANEDEPEDAESSRDAFRTLLNMSAGKHGGDFIESAMATPDSDADVSPVQRRIYEFSDAGMRIPDIARELGVGKGEVKLILSMRGNQA